jgi:hypothetical protein
MTRQCLIILAQIKFYCALFAGAPLLICVYDVECSTFIYLVRGLKSSCHAQTILCCVDLALGRFADVSAAVVSYDEIANFLKRGDMHCPS